jgi:quercetin dioxygenase-like cupin family protein
MSQPALIPTDTAQTLDLTTSVDVSPSSIVSRTLLQTPEVRVVLFAFDAGQELTSHTSRRRALAQILTGSCAFFFNGAWHTLTAGTFLHLPPNHPHAVRAGESPFTMLLTLGSEQVNERPAS